MSGKYYDGDSLYQQFACCTYLHVGVVIVCMVSFGCVS